MPDFMSMRMSSPTQFNAGAGAALAAAASALAQALQQYKKTADLSQTWTGSASQAHNERLTKLVDAASRVIQAITTAKTITATGGAQMTALKTSNDAITASALSSQFVVMPTGTVVPGPPHYAAATGPHGPALMKMFWSIANLFSGQIKGTVAAQTMTDGQVAMQIAAIAAQFFADLLSKKDQGANAGVTLPPGLSDSGLPTTVTPGSTLPLVPPPLLPEPTRDGDGTQLAGVGGYGTLGPAGLGSLGAGGLGGIGGIGGIGGLGPAGLGGVGGPGGFGPGGIGPGGIGPGGVLAGGSGVIGAGGAGQMGAGGQGAAGTAGAGGRAGAAGAGGTPMGGPMGAAGAASQDKRHGAETWLHEDRDPFDPGDDAAPDAVLS